jgi:hypothetical protein
MGFGGFPGNGSKSWMPKWADKHFSGSIRMYPILQPQGGFYLSTWGLILLTEMNMLLAKIGMFTAAEGETC